MESFMRKPSRTKAIYWGILNRIFPWRFPMRILKMDVAGHKKRLNGISYKLRELELSYEDVSGRLSELESKKPRRGRPRKKLSLIHI